MNLKHFRLFSIMFAAVVSLGGVAQTRAQVVVAFDNFDGAEYDTNITPYGQNGGSGFGPITYLGGINGGVFFSNFDGRGLGIFAGVDSGNSQGAGRTVTNAVMAGAYSLSASFNVSNNVAFSGFNLKSGLGSGLGDNELLSIGLIPGAGNGVLFVTDGTGTHTFALGSQSNLTFQNIDFSISFDTGASTYGITATVRSNGQSGTFAGSLIDTNGGSTGTGAVTAIGFGNFNSGSNQDLLFDNLSITAIPEPSSAALIAGTAIAAAWFVRRRRA